MCRRRVTRDRLRRGAPIFLQGRENTGKIGRRRATFRPQHTHEAFDWNVGLLFERLKSNRGVDVIAQDGLSGFKVASEIAFHSLTQKRLPEFWFALRPFGWFFLRRGASAT
jgi:hypothetical protein